MSLNLRNGREKGCMVSNFADLDPDLKHEQSIGGIIGDSGFSFTF